MKPNLNISIGLLNIEGVNDKIFGCKIKQLKEYLKCDIEILSETWGECNHYNEIEGYNFIKNGTKRSFNYKRKKFRRNNNTLQEKTRKTNQKN